MSWKIIGAYCEAHLGYDYAKGEATTCNNQLPCAVHPRITVADNTETIRSCNTCGKSNYDTTKVWNEVVPTGLHLNEVTFHLNEHQASVMVLCDVCLQLMVVAAEDKVKSNEHRDMLARRREIDQRMREQKESREEAITRFTKSIQWVKAADNTIQSKDGHFRIVRQNVAVGRPYYRLYIGDDANSFHEGSQAECKREAGRCLWRADRYGQK